ncbi:hypothetical protein PISMIDRAFT_686562 [Pisolithus microcarpus 441]|uniref:Uncharacterized protein n=1 Tax=Pisolithus microcarpus 441 TaxID=765257 RepID=A0A0C9Z1H9_9AGAM|nr:hypothetical protein BKA83DRAFT_686562 [Pisolithus microcarpus]KIK16167.1 hypothetical protein PISMIDRAFT_686562 [Pisolithus microcarpus 441]
MSRQLRGLDFNACSLGDTSTVQCRPFHFIDAMHVSIKYDLSKMSERVQDAKPPGRSS